jgi:hypothetical protein
MPASWNQNQLAAKLGIEYIAWTDQVRLGLAALAQLLRRLNANVDRPTSCITSTDTTVSPIPSVNCFGPTGLAKSRVEMGSERIADLQRSLP